MNRSVMTQAATLAAALIAAYFVWTREPDTSAGDVSILSIRSGISKVSYEEPDLKVEIEKRKDSRGSYYWVKTMKMVTPPRKRKPRPTQPRTAPTANPRGAHAGHGHGPGKHPKTARPGTTLNKDPKANPEKGSKPQPVAKKAPAAAKGPVAKGKALPKGMKITTPKALAPALPKVAQFKEFRGNETTEKLVTELSNLTALRVLGKVDAAKLKAFGLVGSKKKLVLTIGSAKRTFIIGNKTHGNMDYYVQDSQDERVYVIKPKQMQNLKYAQYRLIDRRLYEFKTEDIDKVVVTAGEKSKGLSQHNRRKKREAFWSLVGSEKREDLYTNWMTKLLRLRVSDYLPPGFDLKGLKPIMKAEFSLGSKVSEVLTMYKMKSDLGDGKQVKEGDYLVKTGHTRSMVKLTKSVAGEIARELDSILGEK